MSCVHHGDMSHVRIAQAATCHVDVNQVVTCYVGLTQTATCYVDVTQTATYYAKITQAVMHVHRAQLTQHQPHPWRTMECSQPAAWTTNRSLHTASRAKALPGTPTNSGSTLLRAAHRDGGVIACHQCITSHTGSAPASPDMRPNPPGFVPHAYLPPPPSLPPPNPPQPCLTTHTHQLRSTCPPSMRSSSASEIILRRLRQLNNNDDQHHPTNHWLESQLSISTATHKQHGYHNKTTIQPTGARVTPNPPTSSRRAFSEPSSRA